MMNSIIETVENRQMRSDLPAFQAGDTVRVEVTPVSAYGTRGRSIAATVDGNSLRSGTAKFGGLSVVGI